MTTTTQAERDASVSQLIEDFEFIASRLGYCQDSDFGLSKLQILTDKSGNLREQFRKEFERISPLLAS